MATVFSDPVKAMPAPTAIDRRPSYIAPLDEQGVNVGKEGMGDVRVEEHKEE